MGKFLIGTALMVLSFNTLAGYVDETTTITALTTYGVDNAAVHNDIVIKVVAPGTGCEGGFWLKSTDSLANKNMSTFLLSAFHSNTKVRFLAYSNQQWSGSTGKFCKLYAMSLVK